MVKTIKKLFTIIKDEIMENPTACDFEVIELVYEVMSKQPYYQLQQMTLNEILKEFIEVCVLS